MSVRLLAIQPPEHVSSVVNANTSDLANTKIFFVKVVGQATCAVAVNLI
jgi:hypothetical protein